MKGKWLIAASVATLMLAAVWWIGGRQDEGVGATYNGKTAAEWFFGDRTNYFLAQAQRNAAESAFKAMGTNGLPFLWQQLERRESALNAIYFKVHPGLPRILQTRLPRPISRSDIQYVALDHIGKLRSLPAHWTERLALWVLGVKDDQIRYRGMGTVMRLPGSSESNPHVIGMLNKLLQDRHFLIRMEAALELKMRDYMTTNAFPVLQECIADYQLVSRSVIIRGYRFAQPPNSTNRAVGGRAFLPGGMRLPDQPTIQQTEALRALVIVEPSLNRTSREKLWLTFSDLPIRTPPEQSIDRVGLFPDDVEKAMGLRTRGGIRLLISLLADPDPARRARAARALRWFGDRASEAMPALKKALDDPSEEVRSAAQAAQRSMTGEKADETKSGPR